MLVVADAGPVIALVGVGRLGMLRDLYDTVLVPPEVVREVAPSLPDLPGWLRPARAASIRPPDIAGSGLGPGETAAIHLALDRAADWLLLDDLDARRWAIRRGMPVVGTAGVLVLAKQRGLLPEVRPVLDELIRTGTFIGPRLYDGILRSVGEAD